MSYLYKRSNWFWRQLIERRLVHAVWRPLVELTRQRHMRFRARLASKPESALSAAQRRASTVVSAGV